MGDVNSLYRSWVPFGFFASFRGLFFPQRDSSLKASAGTESGFLYHFRLPSLWDRFLSGTKMANFFLLNFSFMLILVSQWWSHCPPKSMTGHPVNFTQRTVVFRFGGLESDGVQLHSLTWQLYSCPYNVYWNDIFYFSFVL